MGIRSNYATDRKLETEGVEIAVDTNEHNGEPIYVTLCRMGTTNKAYTRALEEATRPHQAAIQAETLDNDLGATLLRGVFVDTCLKSWRNLPKSELSGDPKDTDDLPFTRENAIALFDLFPDFYNVVEAAAKKAANFREAVRKGNAKN